MPRFFFDVSDHNLEIDKDGVELEGLNAARLEAVRLSGELLQQFPDKFWSSGEWSCSVRDERGLILFILHFFATEAATTSSQA